MGSVIANVPYNPDFNYDEWAELRRQVFGSAKFVWEPDNLDHMRLPGNMHIQMFLVYLGKLFKDFQTRIGYAGENILYSGSYPDIIYTSVRSGTISADSPHVKIPPHVCYALMRRSPASSDPPFGVKKQWKYRSCGEFKDSQGRVWQLRSRWWENLVEFTIIARSDAEADMYCLMFEHFMDLDEYYFLKAGLAKIVPFGRIAEGNPTLEQAGVRYRKTLYWMLTQEFQYIGPLTTITDIHMDVDTGFPGIAGLE